MIGQVVKAKGRTTLRIVGADAGAWIAQPAEGFAAPRRLTAAEMAAYGIAPPSSVDPDAAAVQADARRTAEANRTYFNGRQASRVEPRPPGFSPEEAFEAAAADTASAARSVAERILADPVKLAAVDSGEVGVHPAVARGLEALRADT